MQGDEGAKSAYEVTEYPIDRSDALIVPKNHSEETPASYGTFPNGQKVCTDLERLLRVFQSEQSPGKSSFFREQVDPALLEQV